MLKDLFVSEVRVKILKIMLTNPNMPYHVRALVREVGTEINAVRRELQRLTDIGLLVKKPSGNRLYYGVDTGNKYYADLLALIAKDFGLGAFIISAGSKLGNIKYAALSKAFVRGRLYSLLNVDLLLVGDGVNEEEVKKQVQKAEKELSREVNYTLMTEEEFMFRKRKNDPFILNFLTQSRTMLIGDEEEFSTVFIS